MLSCLRLAFAIGLLSLSSTSSLLADIGAITYESGTNTWTISGFEKSGIGSYVFSGTGMAGPGPHVRVGNGVSINWQSFGGFHYYNGTSEFTDYYHPDTTSWTVTGATWTNAGTNADGTYYEGLTSLGALLTPISDGTILNGTFSWESSTGGAGTGKLLYQASVPEPSGLVLIGIVSIGNVLICRRKKLTG